MSIEIDRHKCGSEYSLCKRCKHEEEKYKDCVFEVLSEPYNICGSTVVKMKCHETGKYFGGGYAIEYLRKEDEGK